MALKTFDLSGASRVPSGWAQSANNPIAKYFYQAQEDALRRKYAPPIYESKIALQGAQAQKATQEAREKQLIGDLLARAMGQGPSRQQQDRSAMAPEMMQEDINMQQYPGGEIIQEEGIESGEPMPGAMDEDQMKELVGAALARVFNVTPQQTQLDTGELLTSYGPGGVFKKKVGPSKAEITESIKNATNRAEYKKELSENYERATDQLHSLDYVSNLMADPMFKEITGPLMGRLGNYIGSEKAQELFGQVDAATKHLGADMFHLFGGRMTDSHQRYIEGLKANKLDSAPVFAGKVYASAAMTKVKLLKNRLVNDYIDKGMNRIEANEAALDQIPINKILNDVKKKQKIREKEFSMRAQGGVRMTLPDGRIYNVPADKVDQLKEKYQGATFGKSR